MKQELPRGPSPFTFPAKRAHMMKPVRVELTNWLHSWLESKRKDWSTLREREHGRLGFQQHLEMLQTFASEHMGAHYIKNFKPESLGPGRPRRSTLGSSPQVTQPTVSEEQLDASEDGQDEISEATSSGGGGPSPDRDVC
jgi:hypothetical protein